MLRIVPSQVVEAIKNLFGSQAELDPLPHSKQKEVRTVLALIEEVPRELIDLPFHDYVEFRQCCSALAAMVPAWTLGDILRIPMKSATYSNLKPATIPI